MNVRPFALLGTSVLDEVKRRLIMAVGEWQSAWRLERLGIDIECERAWEAVTHQVQWQRSYGDAGKTVWLGWQADLVKYVQRHVFPPDQRHVAQLKRSSSIAADGAERVVWALSDHVASALALHGADGGDSVAAIPDAGIFSRGSGAVAARIKVGEQMVQCLLSYGCTRAMNVQTAAGSFGTVDVAKALGRVGVTLPVELGKAEVEVGALMTLSVGDVIRLNTSIDKPLTVYGPGGDALFEGYLGRVGNSIALEIAGRGK